MACGTCSAAGTECRCASDARTQAVSIHTFALHAAAHGCGTSAFWNHHLWKDAVTRAAATASPRTAYLLAQLAE